MNEVMIRAFKCLRGGGDRPALVAAHGRGVGANSLPTARSKYIRKDHIEVD